MKCWYDGILQLRKGDILQITKGYEEEYNGYPLRVTLMEIVTTGAHCYSPFDTNRLSKPIVGRVVNSIVRPVTSGDGTTFFEVEEGHFEDYVFVRAGEVKRGQDALNEIFTRRIDEYVKIWDTYISPDTIRLVANVGGSKTILILTDNIDKIEIEEIKNEAESLPNRLVLKKGPSKLYHDRFILTRGEGWSIGHSLKDFGKRNSNLIKLPSSLAAETAFDENWNISETVFAHN